MKKITRTRAIEILEGIQNDFIDDVDYVMTDYSKLSNEELFDELDNTGALDSICEADMVVDG